MNFEMSIIVDKCVCKQVVLPAFYQDTIIFFLLFHHVTIQYNSSSIVEGYYTINLNLACFVPYLKIINTFEK